MDPRLLKYYNVELQHLREVSGEFAQEHPVVAGRLGLDAFECADPYVERLLEGFAFLAARVRLKLDAEFPRFTNHLLEIVYPHFLAPTPSMAVVRFEPTLDEGTLAEGFVVPQQTSLRSIANANQPCEYRTAHEVTLWPLELVAAEYYATQGAVAALGVGELMGARAALRLRIKTTAGIAFRDMALDRLPIYLRGGGRTALRLYEQLFADALAMIVRPTVRPLPWQKLVHEDFIRAVGFAPEESLLPYGPQSFDGYRLLQEYFAFPQRYLFFQLSNLGKAVRYCEGSELDIVILLRHSVNELERAINANEFALFCTPAINLFPRRADRIHLNDAAEEHHVVVDRTQPMDYEIFAISSVKGIGAGNEVEQEFLPFYAISNMAAAQEERAFYAVHREPRLVSSRQRSRGRRSSYIGGEMFISLVDSSEAPYSDDIRQLAIEALCTNRDLPIEMTVGKGATDFTMHLGAPVESIRCLAGPTRPKPSPASDPTWEIISHLSLNYLSLIDSNPEQGAAALRELLSLYCGETDVVNRRQIEGILSIASSPVIRRAPISGPIAFARGVEITLTCAEAAFEGNGVFLLGAILERFFAKYVSINSFTETVLCEVNRGEIMRWKRRIGQRHVL